VEPAAAADIQDPLTFPAVPGKDRLHLADMLSMGIVGLLIDIQPFIPV
jgi:hypothetical protein